MVYQSNNQQAALLEGRTCYSFATLWTVTRTDGFVLRLCDHDTKITSGGNIFVPNGAFLTTARQDQGNMREANFEVEGPLTSSAVTDNDLRLGLYRGAKIVEPL